MNPDTQPYTQQKAAQPDKSKGWIGFLLVVLGIITMLVARQFVFFGIPIIIVGFVFSAKAMRNKKKGFAIAGFVLGLWIIGAAGGSLSYAWFTGDISFRIGSTADKKLLAALEYDGNTEAVKEAIAAGAHIDRLSGDLGNSIGKKREKNPFRLACESYRSQRLAYTLLEQGADPNAIAANGWPIMSYIVALRDIDFCAFMLDKGADINLKGKNGKTPIDACFINSPKTNIWWFASKSDNRDVSAEKIYDFLIQNGAEITSGTLQNALAGENGDGYARYVIIQKIVKQLEEMDQAFDMDPLLISILSGDESAAKLLLSTSKGQDERRLFFSAAFSTPEVLEALLFEDRDLYLRDAMDESLLSIAAKCGNVSMLEYLIPKFDVQGNEGYEALKIAVMNDQLDSAQILIDNQAPFKFISDGQINAGTQAVIDSLLQSGLNDDGEIDAATQMMIDDLRSSGLSKYGIPDPDLLTYACLNGSAGMVQMLIKSGNAGNTYNEAMQIACYYNQTSCLELMIEAGADVNEGSKSSMSTPLNSAARGGSLDCVKLLLQNRANINGKEGGEQPLSIACQYGNLEVAEYLIQHGADINSATSDELWRSPLYNAISSGEFDCIRLLVENGAMINDKMLSHAEIRYKYYGSDNVYRYLSSATE